MQWSHSAMTIHCPQCKTKASALDDSQRVKLTWMVLKGQPCLRDLYLSGKNQLRFKN